MISPSRYNSCSLGRPEDPDARYFPKTEKALKGIVISMIATVATRMFAGRPSWKAVGLIEGGLLAGGTGIVIYRDYHGGPQYKLDRLIWDVYHYSWQGT